MSEKSPIPYLALLLLVACGPEGASPDGSGFGGGAPGGMGGVSGATTGGVSGAMGGSSTGGSMTGGAGVATGGAVTGGNMTGGAGMGGVMTGGMSSGGVGAGGIGSGGSGGMPTGGVSTGGTNSGGVSGGGASTGGIGTGGVSSGGTGGSVTNPYDYGFAPTTVTANDARAAYDRWKAANLESCGDGVYRVKWENAKTDATVSEGIGYGMLLAVSWNEREVFDGLLAYAKLMRIPIASGPFGPPPNTGLMNWLRYGCDAHRAVTYSDYPDGAAADADLDLAMALLMASCRWGDASYGTEATSVIDAIRQHMFWEDSGLSILQPGDGAWFDDTEIGMPTGCVNYSYFAPAYYRAFAEHVPEAAGFWNDAANDAYTLLERAAHGSTGLVRNWGSADGGDAVADCYDSYTRASSYGDDAARTPWRIGTDYIWYGTAAAKSWADKVTAWVKTVPIANTGQWYNRDGSLDTEAPGYGDHTVINVGPWAVGAMSSDQATVDQFAAEVVAIPSGPGAHDDEYFNRMLKALSLLTLSGGFTRCGGG